PLRADEDGVLAGRPLFGGRDRRGAEAREQALERRTADPPGLGGRGAGRTPRHARGTLDPRAPVTDTARGRAAPRRVRLLTHGERALSPHLRRLLRLVRRGGESAALRRRRGRARHRGGGTRTVAEAPAPRDAARDGRDLVEPAGTGDAADRGTLARGGRRGGGRCAYCCAGSGGRLPPERLAAQIGRRGAAHLRRRREAEAGRRFRR